MFEGMLKFFKGLGKSNKTESCSKEAAKERLHLVLMQDRANVSADFLDLMKQEIIDVIKKYIDVDESAIDVRLTNKQNDDGTTGIPALYANIPIVSVKNDIKKDVAKEEKQVQEDAKAIIKAEAEKDKKEDTKNCEEKIDKDEKAKDKKATITEEKTDNVKSKVDSKELETKSEEKNEAAEVVKDETVKKELNENKG